MEALAIAAIAIAIMLSFNLRELRNRVSELAERLDSFEEELDAMSRGR